MERNHFRVRQSARSSEGSGGRRRWWALISFGAAVCCAAVVGGLAARDSSADYTDLELPAWAPPAGVFGPVWTVLYAMITASGWLVWRRGGFGAAFWAWGAQLVLNAVWSPLFFGAGQYGLAFANIVLLWSAIGGTVLLSGRISRVAATLLLPYWAWVSYAALLNLAIWRLNA
ncbi:TspO/MBR family protein [Salinispora cortesiana]|uniref:TspO/MBR family protein n=1 Tax=Salinispora cortesiana TaxID=1305843 RepID=UPI000413B78B|nr:TspO/MBR family protein [Salinispora cortesiana]